jgi:hypothetical protein
MVATGARAHPWRADEESQVNSLIFLPQGARRTVLVALALVLVGVVLVGCSSKAPSATRPSTSSTAVSTTSQAATTGSASSTEAFCQQYTAFIKTLNANVVTPEGFAQFKQGYAALAANAPSSIQADMASLSAQAQALPSAQAVTSVTTGTAQTTVDNWVKSNCPNFSADVLGGK